MDAEKILKELREHTPIFTGFFLSSEKVVNYPNVSIVRERIEGKGV